MPLEARFVTRSGVPDGRGGGGAPATIGSTLQLRGGIALRIGSFHLRLAPELTAASNGDFLTFPGRDTARSSFASPFYVGRVSADLPSRPGVVSLLRVDPGESSLWFIGARYTATLTTALPDWGPGIGEGLVLGRSTAGIPRLELAAWRPFSDGTLRIRWLGGAAVESRFFDQDRGNDRRGIAGLRVTYARNQWTVGLARTVMDTRASGIRQALLAPLQRSREGTLELLSTDLRFADRRSGSFAWLEAARQRPVRRFRDLLLTPTEGLALRVGATQRIATTAAAHWILGAEAVRLDQPPQRAGRLPQDLYTSDAVPHGWTHRGQPLGSGLGPGGQRQFLSLDREGRLWRLGGFLERVRWNDDALYREYLAYQNRHDVTVQVGVRGGRRLTSGAVLDIAVSAGRRLNYLFQNDAFLAGYRTGDVPVAQLSLTLHP